MNILFLADIVPYPPNTGIKIRTFNIIKELARQENKIFLFCFNHKTLIDDSNILASYVHELNKICIEVHVFDIESDASTAKKNIMMAVNIFQKLPHRCHRYFSRKCADKVSVIVREKNIDLVHLDKTELAVYCPWFGGLPVVSTNHNVESKLMRARVHFERSLARKAFAVLQSIKLENYEKVTLKKLDGYVTCTDLDKSYFEEVIGIKNDHITIENGVDTEWYLPACPRKDEYLMIVGAQNVDSTANFDATHFFMREIWPLIIAEKPDIKLKIVGRNPDKSIMSYAEDPRVDVLGFVPDERSFFDDAIALLVPIRVGGGSRLKILVSMAMGCPLVSTTVGAEGIDVVPDGDILLADTPEDFAAKVLRILDDAELRAKLARNARNLVEARYDWRKLGEKLNQFYADILYKRAMQ